MKLWIVLLTLQVSTSQAKILARMYLEQINMEAVKSPVSYVHTPSYEFKFANNSEDKINMEVKKAEQFSYKGKNKPTVDRLLNSICELFVPKGLGAFGNTLMISSDAMVDNEHIVDKDKAIEFLIHIATSLGLPSFTYIADNVGETVSLGSVATTNITQRKQEPMTLRLEPSMHHMAQAMVDFLQTYSWTTVVLVVSKTMPGSLTLVDEIKRIQKRDQENKSEFVLEISQEVYFDGINMAGLRNCLQSCGSHAPKRPSMMKSTEKCVTPHCVRLYSKVLEDLVKSNNRIFIFHATKMDLRVLIETAWQLRTSRPQYYKLFGKDYVWIISPTGVGGVKDEFRTKDEEHQPDLGLPFGLDGLFGFVFLNKKDSFKRAAQIVSEVWQRSMRKYIEQVYHVISQNHGLSHAQVVQKVVTHLRPSFNCSSQHQPIFWNEGRTLFKIMKSISFEMKGENEIVHFDNDGYLNSTTFDIMNSRHTLIYNQQVFVQRCDRMGASDRRSKKSKFQF